MNLSQDAPVWNAAPHTLAKIGILKGYLNAWLAIFGQRPPAPGVPLVYIDGFAGPGRYKNADEGSPLAALRAASDVLANLKMAGSWRAGEIHCGFIEPDRKSFSFLQSLVEPFGAIPGLRIHLVNDRFAEGLGRLERSLMQGPGSRVPTMVFADPFGAKGVPFRNVEHLLARPYTEALINLDADGISRNWSAGYEAVLDEVFGSPSWRDLLDPDQPFRDRCLDILEYYKERLRSLPRVRHAFSYEMLTAKRRVGTVGYFLVFACSHPTALEKMKEAMKRIDQDGSFSFSNARARRSAFGQVPMFREDDPQQFSKVLLERFAGRQGVRWPELMDFALDETPFVNPKSMLQVLDRQREIEVVSSDPKRRLGTFNEQKILSINFRKED